MLVYVVGIYLVVFLLYAFYYIDLLNIDMVYGSVYIGFCCILFAIFFRLFFDALFSSSDLKKNNSTGPPHIVYIIGIYVCVCVVLRWIRYALRRHL